MWIILGSVVACGLALWHLHVTVPDLVEPAVEEVGQAVLAIKPTYDSLATPMRTFVVAVTAAACGALSIVAPPWACLLYTSPSPRDGLLSRMPSSA